jgi:putative ABC transport system permease protein
MIFENLRYALRTLRHSPGFAAVAICTLAIGIGANTAMFSVIDGVLLKPLPYRDPDHIVRVNTLWTKTSKVTPRLTGGDLLDLRADKDTFEALSGSQGGQMGVQVAGHAEFVGTWFAFPEFLKIFGVAPVAGRLFVDDDAERSAVVGLGFARRNFGNAEAALGQTLHFENSAYQVVGVMPGGFDFPGQAEVWIAYPPEPAKLNMNRTSYNYRTVAKLRPGVSVESANARLAAIAKRLAVAFPDSNENKSFQVVPLRDQLVAPVRSTLYFLMGAVGLVLLIACANVANLMLARNTRRARDLAVRAALGAGRGKLVAQLLAESLLVGVAAALVGLALAQWGTAALLRVSANFVPLPRLNDIQLDWRVLGFAFAAALATTIIFGLAPAWQASRANPHDALKQGGTRAALGGGSSRLRNGLVVAQIALSFTLTIGAGLLFRSFLTLAGTDLGIRTEGVLVMYAHLPAKGLQQNLQAAQFFQELSGRIRQLPGVVAAAGVMGLPTGQYGSNGSYAVEGQSTMEHTRNLPHANFSLSSPGYFGAVGIPLLRGRDFTTGDVYQSEPVAIISQAFAKQSFADVDPIGRRVQCGLDSDKWMTIIGIAGDVRQDSPADPLYPTLYMPLTQHPGWANEQQIVVRTSVEPGTLITPVQALLRSANPDVAARFTTLRAMVADSVAAPRFRTMLASLFAGLALLLAMSGMYAVMSYVTAQRTSEFGLRMALGAQRRDVIRLVLGRALKLVVVGVVVGLALALGASRIIAAMLFGLKNTDTLTYALVLLLLLPVITLTAALPALRAARVDPMVALRDE